MLCGELCLLPMYHQKEKEKLPSCISYLEPSQLSCFLSDGKIVGEKD